MRCWVQCFFCAQIGFSQLWLSIRFSRFINHLLKFKILDFRPCFLFIIFLKSNKSFFWNWKPSSSDQYLVQHFFEFQNHSLKSQNHRFSISIFDLYPDFHDFTEPFYNSIIHSVFANHFWVVLSILGLSIKVNFQNSKSVFFIPFCW